MLIEAPAFHQLLVEGTPLIDTRSPGEFAKGSFPGAVNLPLMNDAERAEVGTCYKQQGQSAAIALGHQLVNGEVKQQRVEAWCEFASRHPNGALFCWRGGLRSDIVCQWMQEAGIDFPKVAGGYKALRRYLIDQMDSHATETSFRVIAGRTGCGKTRCLEQIPSSLDLEGLAHHRGSAFGRRPGGQPSQINFENSLAIALLQSRAKFNGPVVVEDESGFIGSCSLPLALFRTLQQSPVVIVESTLDQRVETIQQDYVIGLLAEYQQLPADNAFDEYANALRNAFARIRKRLGFELYGQLCQLLEEALNLQQVQGDPSLHRGWIEQLLIQYYDPMYDYQMTRQQRPIAFQGTREQVIAWCQSLEHNPV